MTPSPKQKNQRQCIACRILHPRQRLIRVCHSRQPEAFSVDNDPSISGRSAYVCRQSSCLTQALKGKKFQRTLKRAIPDDIVNRLNEQLKGLNG